MPKRKSKDSWWKNTLILKFGGISLLVLGLFSSCTISLGCIMNNCGQKETFILISSLAMAAIGISALVPLKGQSKTSKENSPLIRIFLLTSSIAFFIIKIVIYNIEDILQNSVKASGYPSYAFFSANGGIAETIGVSILLGFVVMIFAGRKLAQLFESN